MDLLTINSRAKLYVVVAALYSSLFVACSDDNDDGVIAPSVVVGDILQSDEYAFHLVFAGLFNTYDSLYNEPVVGEVLDETQPTVYTTGVVDEAAARSFFDNLCSVADRCTSLTDGSIQYDLGTYGNLRYHPFGENGALASLEVNLHEVSSLTRIDFISQDLWPNNDASPFEIGDIVKDSCGYTWVCVQEYGAGLPALFIEFMYATAMYWDSDEVDVRIIYRQCASYDALNAWCGLLKSGRSRFTVGTKENEKLRGRLPYIYRATQLDQELSQLYCSGICVEQTTKTRQFGGFFLCQDVRGNEYHIVAVSEDCGIPVAADWEFICIEEEEKLAKTSFFALLDNASAENNLMAWTYHYLYHTGVVQYGKERHVFSQHAINKQTGSISLQNVQLMQKMFTKVDL